MRIIGRSPLDAASNSDMIADSRAVLERREGV